MFAYLPITIRLCTHLAAPRPPLLLSVSLGRALVQNACADQNLQCLDQTVFKQYQLVSAGKYTIGLGLKYMNYCDDREGEQL